MHKKEAPASEFVETLRAAAAAVGQQAGALDGDRDGQTFEVDQEREARIAELRRQYSEGACRVNPAEVAAKMVDDHLT
jgi:anti-sigma28 factor (negative regulator of flagellin synthesis)